MRFRLCQLKRISTYVAEPPDIPGGPWEYAAPMRAHRAAGTPRATPRAERGNGCKASGHRHAGRP